MINKEYISGICSSLEKNLISDEKIEKMLSLSFNDALKQIKDLGFGKGVDSDFVEDLIDKEELDLIKFVKENSPSEDYTKYYLLSYDYHNAEGLLRSVILHLNENLLLTKEGYYSIDKIRSFIIDGKKCLSNYMQLAIEEAKKELETGKSYGADINRIFIKYKFKEMFSLSKDKRQVEYVKEVVDLLNISVSLRSSSEEYITKYYIEGGTISLFDLKRIIREGLGSFIDSKYKKIVDSAISDKKNDLPFVKLENYCDSFKLKGLMKNKYLLEGYDKFYLYIAYKEAEIKNIRILLVGLKSGIEKNEIKARLRCNYAG